MYSEIPKAIETQAGIVYHGRKYYCNSGWDSKKKENSSYATQQNKKNLIKPGDQGEDIPFSKLQTTCLNKNLQISIKSIDEIYQTIWLYKKTMQTYARSFSDDLLGQFDVTDLEIAHRNIVRKKYVLFYPSPIYYKNIR